MKELHELKDKVYDELKNYSKKNLSASTLNTVKDLAKTAYYLCELIEDEEGYSNRGYEMIYDGRRGNSRARRRNSYERGYDGYSYDGDMISELRDLMEDAKDEKTRQEFKRFIQKMESM